MYLTKNQTSDMNPFKLTFVCLLIILSFQLVAQESFNDKNIKIKLAQSPEDPKLFIARYYDQETDKLLEYWTLKSQVTNINSGNFNQLKKEGKIWPHGKHYTFYPNIKPKIEIDFTYGVGEVKGFYESGELKFEGKYYKGLTGNLKHYFKNGRLKKIENMEFGLPKGKVKQFYDDGKLYSKVNYKKGAIDGTYISYHKNQNIKRKAKFEMDQLISQECFDELGHQIPESPFFVRAAWPFNIVNLKEELNKIDLSFNKENSVTTVCRFTIFIDQAGSSRIEKIDFKNSKEMRPELMNWLSKGYDFSPAVYDGITGSSILNIAFPVCGNKILWFGEPFFFDKRFRDFTTQEDLMVTYMEFPLQEVYECVEIFDEDPQFPGGKQALHNFLTKNLIYPPDALSLNISGKVLVNFIVAPTGNISEISILESVHPLLDAEAYRVVSMMPRWKPAMCSGKPVPVSFGVPINFKTTNSKRRHLETVKTIHVY